MEPLERMNPLAATMTDPRWPSYVVDLGYIRYLDGFWRLFDSFGTELICSENRTMVWMFADKSGTHVVARH